MAKPASKAQFVLFDVFYADGTQRSNRKVPAEILGGLDGDEPARKVIEAQDSEIAKASGKNAVEITRISRSGGNKKR